MTALTDEKLAKIEKRHEGHADCFSDAHPEDYSAYDWAHHDRAALLAEVKRLRRVTDDLCSALMRTQLNLDLAVRGRPVRDMAENLAENYTALTRAALSAKDKA